MSLANVPGYILYAAVFFGIAVFVFEALDALAGAAKPRRRRPEPGVSGREFYPAILGGAAGFLLMAKFPQWAFVFAGLGCIAGQAGKSVYRWFERKLSEEKRSGEVLLLYELIGVYASAGYSLYEALSAGAQLVDLIGEPVRKCLRSWGQGPQRALEKMGKEIGLPEAEALAKILQRATEVGSEKLADFLRQESEVMESVRQYRVESGLSVRPLIQTLYLLFPGLSLVGVTMLPVGYYISRTIMSIRLGG
ncbi:MAG: hypothetical protein ACPLTR_12390 [Thermacetogeniaceae bacterium]